MAQQTRTTLKGFFNKGDKPSEGNFADLIDSKLNISENNIGDIQITGTISASKDISGLGISGASSLNIKSPNVQLGYFKSTVNDQQAYVRIDSANDGTNTHSYIYFNEGGSGRGAVGYNASGDDIRLVYSNGISSTNGIIIQNDGNVGLGTITPGEVLEVIGNISASGNINANHITASGNISASGTIFASKFESAGTSNETISFNDNLNITGNITASGNISASGTAHIFGGNIGIGTALPDERLHIVGNVDDDDVAIEIQNLSDDNAASTPPRAALVLNAASNTAHFRLFGAPDDSPSGHKVDIGSAAANSFLTFSPSGNEKMRITSDGNISASGDLILRHITASGDISSSGTITAAKGIFGTGTTTINDNINTTGNITSSGNISSSGIIISPNISSLTTVTGSLLNSIDLISATTESLLTSIDLISATTESLLNSIGLISATTESLLNSINSTSTITGSFAITGSNVLFSNITSSGNISASGTVSSQNFILGSGGSILATDTSGNTNDVIVGNLADVGLFFGDADMPSTFRGTDMTIDAEADIILDAKGGNIEFKDEGSLQLTLDMDGTAGAQVITPGVAGDDIIFKNQGGDSVLTLKSEGQTEIHGNITASGNISASGDIISDEIITNKIKSPGSSNDLIQLQNDFVEIFGNSKAYFTVNDGSGIVQINKNANDIDFEAYSDNSRAFNINAGNDQFVIGNSFNNFQAFPSLYSNAVKNRFTSTVCIATYGYESGESFPQFTLQSGSLLEVLGHTNAGYDAVSASIIVSSSLGQTTIVDGDINAGSLTLDQNIASSAPTDASFYIINGKRGEIRSQVQASIAADTGWTLELRNTSIAANSLIIANVIGGEGAIITGSIVSANVIAADSASFNFFNTGGVIVDDAKFTASFAIL